MISIRPAIATDVKAMISLIKELALYEKAPEQVINTEDEMLKDGFGEYPLFNAFIAEKENKIIGTAICYLAYSTWKGRYIYLDDLIVTETERKTGAGTLLFEAVFNYAKSINSNQLRWHVLDWNEPAISFYKNILAHLTKNGLPVKLKKKIFDYKIHLVLQLLLTIKNKQITF